MRRFKNILLVADCASGHSPAFERAADLARRNEAFLTVIHVFDALPRDLQILASALPLDDLLDVAIDDRRKQLEHLIGPIRENGVTVDVRVQCGTPFIEIIREVLREQRDLVMMTAEGKPALGEFLFGSTSMHLMRKCPCPVWVMKPGPHAGYSRVMAAVDPMTTDGGHQSLNNAIMQLASSLARIEGSQLHVVHTWLPITERIPLFGHVPLSEPALVAATKQAHQTALDELLRESSLDDVPVQVHLVRGEAGNLIPRLAQKEHIDLIVMGTVCRSGLAGLFIGNTAERVLHNVDCSLLTVKPDGFATPVTLG
jgi:universal stress protein E